MLKEFLEENKARGWDLKAVIVTKDNDIVAEHYNEDNKNLCNQYSVAKALIACSIGILSDRKKLNVDDKISNYIKPINDLPQENYLHKVTIKHLLTNTSGNNQGYLFDADRNTHNTDDYLSLILSRKIENEPGLKYAYSNSNYYLLSRIINIVAKTDTHLFIVDNIYKPLNIKNFDFVKCPLGHFLGGGGLLLTTQDLSKIGVMFACYGKYKENQIVSHDFLEQAFYKQVSFNKKEGYGYSFMMKDSQCVFVAGNFNQLLLIDKINNVSVSVNSNVVPSETATLMKVVKRTIIK